MLLKTIPGGQSLTFQTNYLGNFLVLMSPSSEDINVSQVKVTPLGDGVLTDLDKAGVDAIGTVGLISSFTGFTNNNLRIIPLADGIVPQKVTDITIENAGTGNLSVYMPVYGKGTTYVRNIMQTVLAGSQSTFADFSILAFDTTPGDNTQNQITVSYEDNANHTFDLQELVNMTSLIQDVQKALVDNREGYVSRVSIIPDVDRKAYIQRYDAIGNL